MQKHDIVVIGAGLTGLTTAFNLKKKGRDVLVLEKQNRIGGQIRTYTEDGFTFESGPNTGVVSFPEVAELFQNLDGSCQLEIARESSKRRLIWKGNKFHALPAGPGQSMDTVPGELPILVDRPHGDIHRFLCCLGIRLRDRTNGRPDETVTIGKCFRTGLEIP